MDDQYQKFIQEYPGYRDTGILDRLREEEFSRLDRQDHTYVDYTGGALYSELQIRQHAGFLAKSILGNPHSINPASKLSTELAESCRHRILEFFNASPDEYVPIFTANATHALKLVGESFPFCEGDTLLLTFDNHNSVNGIREFDRHHGATTSYVPIVPPDMRVDDREMIRYLDMPDTDCHKLLAYPAQSNFSGVQHPLDWIEPAHQRGWDVLIDAAAFVPTNRLDLSRWHPDYVAISFYKMFGYPTGAGALIARRKALDKLNRPWFAGGTITVASVVADTYTLAPGAEGFEDGTINYACLPAVESGLDFMDRVGIDTIHRRVNCLTGWFIRQILELRHSDGKPLVRLYGPAEMKGRGGTVAINVCDGEGKVIDHMVVEKRAIGWNISLRTGCFCNPGADEAAMNLTGEEISRCFHQPDSRLTYDEFRMCIDKKDVGAVRISFGMATNFKDVQKVIEFLGEFRE